MISQLAITGNNGKTTTSDLAREILRFQDLRKSFGGRVVLDGVSAEVRPGEVILLRGQNGSGKTTLLNILTGCLEPDSGTISYLSPPPPVRIVSAGESDEVADLPSTIYDLLLPSPLAPRHQPVPALHPGKRRPPWRGPHLAGHPPLQIP